MSKTFTLTRSLPTMHGVLLLCALSALLPHAVHCAFPRHGVFVDEAIAQSVPASAARLETLLSARDASLSARQRAHVTETTEQLRVSSLREAQQVSERFQREREVQTLHIQSKLSRSTVSHLSQSHTTLSHTATATTPTRELAESESAAPFSCVSPSPIYSPYTFCSGVVDYAFFLPAGVTEEDLNAQAKTWANYYSAYLPQMCLSNVKRMICSAIYLPCVDNVVPGDYSTYQPAPDNVNISLPYNRPCMSVCAATTFLDSSCGGKLEMFGLDSRCTSSVDIYSGLPLYLPDDTQRCHAIPSVHPLTHMPYVAAQKEPYLGEVCAGIVSEYQVPPPTSLDPQFAPHLPPFVLQTITENILSTIEALIPRYLTSECLVAQRALVCSSYFLEPYSSNALAFLFGEIQLPSFPDRAVCTRYEEQCAYLIGLVPALAVDCESSINGLQLYPNGSQTIAVVDLGFAQVPLIAPSNTLSDMTFTITSQCPYGFTVVTEPNQKNALVATGTACTALCPVQIYTDEEYSLIYSQSTTSLYIALALTSLQTINIFVIKPQRRNIFLVAGIVSSLLYIAVQVTQALAMDKVTDAICASETSWHTLDDFGSDVNADFCVLTAVLGPFISLFTYWILLAMAGEIWLRVAMGVKKVEPLRIYYMYLPAAILAAQGLVIYLYGQPDVGHAGGFALFCSWSTTDVDLEYYTGGLPFTIYLAVALGLVGHALYICVKTSLKVQDADRKPLKKIWKSYSMLFLFLGLDLVVFPVSVFLIDTKWNFVDSDIYIEGSVSWIACLFTQFTSSDDDNYLHVCGRVPQKRIEVTDMLTAFLLTAYLTPIMLLYITMNKEVKDFWWSLFVRALSTVGLAEYADVLLRIPGLSYLLSSASQGKKPSSSNETSRISRSQRDKDSENLSVSGRPSIKPQAQAHKTPSLERRNSIVLNLARLARQRTPSMIKYAHRGGGALRPLEGDGKVAVDIDPRHQVFFEQAQAPQEKNAANNNSNDSNNTNDKAEKKEKEDEKESDDEDEADTEPEGERDDLHDGVHESEHDVEDVLSLRSEPSVQALRTGHVEDFHV